MNLRRPPLGWGGVLAVTCAASAVLGAGSAQAATVCVVSGTACDTTAPTIGAAVLAAQSGDTVAVPAGRYDLSTLVTITKGLRLQGPNAGVDPDGQTRSAEAVITSSGAAGQALRVATAEPVTVDGFSFDAPVQQVLSVSTTGSRSTFANNIVQHVDNATKVGLIYSSPATVAISTSG